MTPYKTYSDVYHHGNHLEHIHTYYAAASTTKVIHNILLLTHTLTHLLTHYLLGE